MKNKKYIFNDHYKKSKDVIRNILGLYFDYNNNKLYEKSFPLKNIFAQSQFFIDEPILVDESVGLYKQKVTFKPKDTEYNRLYLQSFYQIEPSGNENIPPEIIAKTIDKMIKEYSDKEDNKYYDFNSIYYNITNEQSNFDNWFSKVNSKYNFYIENYEKLISSNDVPEEILPNFYVTNLALNRNLLDSISQKDYNSSISIGDDSPFTDFYNKFDNFITLENNVIFNPNLFDGRNTLAGLIFGVVLIAYCEQYASVYDSVSVDFIETAKKRFGQLFANITNKELLDKLNEFKSSYPMYNEIIWSTNSIGPLTQFLENANISLQSFQDFINSKLTIDVNSNNPFLQNIQFNVLSNVGLSNFSEQIIQKDVYDIGVWISNFLDKVLNEESVENFQVSPVTFLNGPREIIQQNQDNDLVIPVFDNVEDILNALGSTLKLNELLTSTLRSYKQIIDGELAQSEILFYKIEKRDSNLNLIQTFYIPNVIGLDIQTYVDTQVKYQKVYKYKIFGYLAVYGSEYYYKKEIENLITPNFPFFVPEDEILDLSNNQFNEGIQVFNNNQNIQSSQSQSTAVLPSILSTNQDSEEEKINTPADGVNSSVIGQQNNVTDIREQRNSRANRLQTPISQQVTPESIASLQDNIDSVNQLTNIVQNASIETINDLDLFLQEEKDLYEDKINEAFLDGYKFTVFYRPVIKLFEIDYTDELFGRVIDFPPTPPIVLFEPIKDCSNKFYIIISPSSGEIKQKPLPIFYHDALEYFKYTLNQNISDGQNIIFKYEGEIKKYESFRIENEPENYISFSTDNTLVRKFYEEGENILIKEEVEKNKWYYYTFRCYDYHNKYSNPSPVYKIKIYENNGVEYLDVFVHEFKERETVVAKNFKRYLKISPQMLQMEYDHDKNKLGLLDESVYDQDFIVKIKSKHTGKEIHLNIKFEKNDII